MSKRGLESLKAGLLGLAAWAAFVVTAAPNASASFAFNVGGVGPSVQTLGFQENAGNAIAKNALTAIASGPGSTFQLYFQTTLTGLNTANGIVGFPSGTYTVVGSITETVGPTTINGGQSQTTFGVSAVQAAQSGLTMYFNPANNAADPAAGTGFIGPTAILTASPVASIAGNQNSFVSQLNPPYQTFNQTNSGGYPGVQAVFGAGTYTVNFTASSVNPSFFPGGVPSVLSMTLNGTTFPTFASVAPSTVFTGLGPGGTNVIPNIGTINGVATPGATDFMIQTIGLITAVPEPSSVCLMGLGLGGLVLLARKRVSSVA